MESNSNKYYKFIFEIKEMLLLEEKRIKIEKDMHRLRVRSGYIKALKDVLSLTSI